LDYIELGLAGGRKGCIEAWGPNAASGALLVGTMQSLKVEAHMDITSHDVRLKQAHYMPGVATKRMLSAYAEKLSLKDAKMLL
jgi:hypothetical protein